MISKNALKQMENDINEVVTAEVLVIYNFKGQRWVNPSNTFKISKGDRIVINFNGINLEEYNNITETKKWWQFWK